LASESAQERRGDFLVTGDAVNVASRLQQAAEPGEILVGARTAAAAAAGYLFGQAREIAVKGKRQPLRVHPLVGPRPARQFSHPPLIGRKADLTQLALLAKRAHAERRPQLVTIIAPAGTGKTRLLEAFLARLNPAADFHVATARCLPYGQNLTYWPLRGLLEELLGGAFTAARVADAFAGDDLSRQDAERLAEHILTPLGVEVHSASAPPTDREMIFSGWRLLVERLAARAPRVIVFEDLHWASESLLDLVEYIMQPRTQAPLLIVATSRPELLDRRPVWGGGRRNFTAVALEPLSDAHTRTLVGKLASNLSEMTRQRISERSGGNPFFVIELTRALAARTGASDDAAPDALPDTVQEALQEQLDLLAAPERVVLQAAAVAGRRFHPATLRAMLPSVGTTEVDAALERLVARELIAPIEDGAFIFRHVLIRDVAYGTLARAERVRLHRAVATWLEEFARERLDEFVELIAYHYREAARLARQSAISLADAPDTGDAVRFLARAGELASRAGAYLEAERFLQSAIELAPPTEHQRLHEALGDGLARGDSAIAAYRRALEAWRASATPDPLAGARLLRKLCGVYIRWIGSYTTSPRVDEIAAWLAEAQQLAILAGDEYEQWRVRSVWLHLPYYSGEITLDEAPARLAECLAAADYFAARGDSVARSDAVNAYAEWAGWTGQHETAIAALRGLLDAPDLTSHERTTTLAHLTAQQADAGDYAGVLTTMRAAMARRTSVEPVSSLGVAALWACEAAYISGRWSELADFTAVIDEAWERAERNPAFSIIRVGHLFALFVGLAREDKAATERAAAAAEWINWDAESHRLASALKAAALSDDAAPLEAIARATIKRESSVTPPQKSAIMFMSERGVLVPRPLLDLLASRHWVRFIHPLSCALAIAEALAAGDNARLAAAIEDAETQGLIPHAARMRIELARRTGDRQQLERARPVLERLGDRQFLRRLDELSAHLG
jgi:hypothetical protein